MQDDLRHQKVDQSSHDGQDSCKPRIYRPETEEACEVDSPKGSEDAGQIRVRLGEVLPLLVEALGSRRSWLDDFADDEVAISVDLHDVLEAYRNFWFDAA